MKVNGDEIKYYAKFGINASGILEATSKTREISAFTVQKIYHSDTVVTQKYTRR